MAGNQRHLTEFQSWISCEGEKKKKEKRKKEKKQAVAVSHLGGSLTVCCAGVPEPSQSATGNKIQCNRYVNFLTVEVSNCV